MTPALKEAAKPGQNRVLAIDFGRKRMGLALSDELRMTARPLVTLTRTNRRNDLRRLRELVRTHGVGRIVVGNPVRLDGSEGEMAKEAAQFAARIQKELHIPVEMFDERLSSWEAQETATVKRPKRNKQDIGIDAVAAAVILRDFLEREHTRKPTKK
jgi:putative Holliday junction resolvase